MTQSAVGFKTLYRDGQGRERKTDGLWTHLGNLNMGGNLTASGTINGSNGLNITGQGTFAKYDATTVYNNLQIQLVGSASPVGIGFHNAGYVGGSLYMPHPETVLHWNTGSGTDFPILPARYVANGIFQTGSSWSTSGNNVWQESTIQITPTSLRGIQCRIEWSVCFSNNTAGAANFVGLGWDGALGWQVAIVHSPGANYLMQCSGVIYATPGPGAHRCSMFFNTNVGVITARNDTNQVLSVVEVG